MRWYLESALGYESGSYAYATCIHVFGQRRCSTPLDLPFEQSYDVNDFFNHILDVFPFKIQWFPLLYLCYWRFFWPFFLNQDCFVHQVNLGKSREINPRCDDESSSSNSSPTPRKFRSKLAPLAFGFSAKWIHWRWPLKLGGGLKFIGRGGSYRVDFLVDFVLLVVQLLKHISKNTPLKRNMFPENQWLEDIFPIEIVPLVLGGCIHYFFVCQPIFCLKVVLSDKVN